MLTKCKLGLMLPPRSPHLSTVDVDRREAGAIESDSGVPDNGVVRDECIVCRTASSRTAHRSWCWSSAKTPLSSAV
jgi:hypothetical protein